MSIARRVLAGVPGASGDGAGWTDNPGEAHMALTPSMQDGEYAENLVAITSFGDETNHALTLTPSMQDGEYVSNLRPIDGGGDDMTLTPSMQDGEYAENLVPITSFGDETNHALTLTPSMLDGVYQEV